MQIIPSDILIYLFLLSLVIILFLGAVLVKIVVRYQKFLEEYSFIDARAGSLKYIDKRMKRMMLKAEGAVARFEREFEKNLFVAAREESEAFRQSLIKSRLKAAGEFDALAKFFAEETKSECSYLRQAVERAILDAERQFQVQGRERMGLMEAEVEKYKKEALAKVDSEIGAIVSKVILTTSGILIDPEKHRQLLVTALEDAKKERLF
jgi:hypothetical protein